MKILLWYFIFILIICCAALSCKENSNTKKNNSNLSTKAKGFDTVCNTDLLKLPFKELKEYFLIINKDSSKLTCLLRRYLNNQVSMEITFAENKFYKQQFEELKRIFQCASTEFQFDSLKIISNFYLIETGDLAIEITKQLSAEDKFNVTDNHKTADFLMKSQLTTDLNLLFAAYGLQVKRYAIEHPMLIDSTVFLQVNKRETLHSEVPKKILDGQLWIYF
jgi:hypothetical protein